MARSIPSRGRPSNVRPISGKVDVTPPAPVELHAPDSMLLIALLGLVSVGMIMVYSATAHESGIDIARRMSIQFGGGVAGLLIGLLLPLHLWRKLTPLSLSLVVLALASLLVPGNPLAIEGGGAVRWLGVGSASIQPSEFGKLALVLFAANYLERRGPKMRLFSGWNHWIPFLSILGLLGGLIYLEPDLGTALVVGGTAFCMLWVSGVDWKALVVGILAAAVLVGAAAMAKQHQRLRLMAWSNPWEYHQANGHQVIQSWTALARGGWWGVGLGQSLQKLDNRLPEAETDFIFAVVAEELGLVRASGVILLFILFVWRGYAVAARAPDRYTGLVALGVTSWIAVQSGLNLGVITGTIPNTGVPLPFLSSGGSSLLALMMAVGILVAISRRTRTEKKEAIR